MGRNIKCIIILQCFVIYILLPLIDGCIGGGTLGGFKTYFFCANKQKLSNAIDTLYKKHPNYCIPEKWKSVDDWSQRGYDFLDSRIFYFKEQPEEMYYVTFIGDSLQQAKTDTIEIAIRAVWSDNKKWKIQNEFSPVEQQRIERRFNEEIILSLNEIIRN